MYIVQREKDISRQTNYIFQNPFECKAYFYAKHFSKVFGHFHYEKQDGKKYYLINILERSNYTYQ